MNKWNFKKFNNHYKPKLVKSRSISSAKSHKLNSLVIRKNYYCRTWIIAIASHHIQCTVV